jgi:hypothetical protein
MVALTIIIGGAVVVVLVIAAVRALRRASRRIDDIIHEELDEAAPSTRGTEPIEVEDEREDD